MSQLTIKSRRNAYSIVGDEVSATSAVDAARQGGVGWNVSLAGVQALTMN